MWGECGLLAHFYISISNGKKFRLHEDANYSGGGGGSARYLAIKTLFLCYASPRALHLLYHHINRNESEIKIQNACTYTLFFVVKWSGNVRWHYFEEIVTGLIR